MSRGTRSRFLLKLSLNLFGWKHYYAVYNGHDSRGWLGYCGLVRRGGETRQPPYIFDAIHLVWI